MGEYVLRRGEEGAQRLEVLGRAAWNSTRALLERTQPQKGWRCLDVGCGVGAVTTEIARLCGHCLGVDIDTGFIDFARGRSVDNPRSGVDFQVGSLESLVEAPHTYDLVYSRYLLSHLQESEAAFGSLVSLVKPGGWLLLEDIDFPGHVHHPPNPAFRRYLELYEGVVSIRGGNARVGRELFGFAQRAGMAGIELSLVVALSHDDDSKRVAELTLEHISGALLSTGLAFQDELEKLLEGLRAYRADPGTLMSIAPTFQLRARRL